MAHLRERIGEGVIVRSDDVVGNDILGEATWHGRRYRVRIRCNDDGTVAGSDIEPA
ncbi:MAG TPA: hypothetical protein VNL92_04575 [Dehalococcoidia bacterium]|nr:hypothetical protein [Dehalococcoidia bacterium]